MDCKTSLKLSSWSFVSNTYTGCPRIDQVCIDRRLPKDPRIPQRQPPPQRTEGNAVPPPPPIDGWARVVIQRVTCAVSARVRPVTGLSETIHARLGPGGGGGGGGHTWESLHL